MVRTKLALKVWTEGIAEFASAAKVGGMTKAAVRTKEPTITSKAMAAGIVSIAEGPGSFEDDVAANLFSDGGAVFVQFPGDCLKGVIHLKELCDNAPLIQG